MVRYNGPIRVFNPSDGIPTDAAGGGAGGDQTAAALSGMSAQAQAAWQTVDNLSATATTGPVGSGASVTITGTVPNKTINFVIPRGRDGKDGVGNDAAVQVAMSQQAGTAMRVGVEAGTVGLLVIADSKGAGTGLTNYVDRWQNRLAALMRARFPITGGDTMRGLIPANMSDPYNAMSGRPTTTGTTYPVDTAGLGYNTLQLELGSVLTFPAATWPAASTLPIGYHTHSGANGTLQVLVDGVVATEINCAGTGEGEPKRTSIPIAAGTHTVSMRPKAGTAPVRPMYIEQRSAATGWHLYDAARPGLAARHVIDRPGAPQGGSSFAAAVAGLPSVRLAVVALGVNDMTISDPAQYGSDLRAVVGMVKAGHPTAGVVVVLPAALTEAPPNPPSGFTMDVQAYHTAARAALTGVPDLSILAETQLVDLTGPNAGAWLADSVHPNAFGHDVIARALAGSLVGLDGPSDALTLVEAAAAPAVTAAQAAQTSAAQSASSAAEARTLAQQAQAAKLEIPDNNVSALVGNPSTKTRQELAKVLPSKRVEVASMSAWTGNPNDDQSAAFAQAAAVHAGPMTIGVPVGTWKAQGLILREGLYYVGQGIEATTLTLPDSPTDHLMRATEHGTIWSGGVLSMTLAGKGGVQGVGATAGINGVDLESYDQVQAFEIRDCLIRGFDRGVNGSQNGGIGDDRWLMLINTRVWQCIVGVYANEHPQLVGVDIRECHFGVAGRLYDFGMVGGKINRCIVGIGGKPDARCTNLNASISSVSFYRNETAVILQNYSSVTGCWIKGGHPDATRPSGVTVRGIVCDGQRINITGCRFGTAAFQCDVDIDIPSGSPTTHRIVNITGCYFLAGGGSHPAEQIACVRAPSGGSVVYIQSSSFDLAGSARGIYIGGGHIAWNVTDNQAYITGDGQFMATTGYSNNCTFERNQIFASGGIVMSRPMFDMALSSASTNWYRDNVLRTISGTTATLLSIDSRSAHVDGNVVATNCTVVQWINAGGVGTVQFMGLRNSGPGTEARAYRAATGTIQNGQSSLVITHGLAKIPISVVASAVNAMDDVWVSARTATTFTLNRSGTTGALVVAYTAYAFDA